MWKCTRHYENLIFRANFNFNSRNNFITHIQVGIYTYTICHSFDWFWFRDDVLLQIYVLLHLDTIQTLWFHVRSPTRSVTCGFVFRSSVRKSPFVDTRESSIWVSRCSLGIQRNAASVVFAWLACNLARPLILDLIWINRLMRSKNFKTRCQFS